jgi:hypothetical protein
MISKYIYAKRRLTESGINFKEIPEGNVLLACKQYHGTISKENYETVIDAVKDIYQSIKS